MKVSIGPGVITVVLMFTVSCGLFKPERAEITTREIEAHIRFLADDALEGRAVGSRGIAVAALYHENYFRLLGLEPFFEGGHIQSFDMKGSRPDRTATLEVLGGGRSQSFKFYDSLVIQSFRADCPEGVEGELVYCGYLIQAPERGWDDLKAADLKGKVILCEINEPGNFEGGVFDGEDMTYYGRWRYKFEKASELGAAGVLIIHNTKGAAYGWDVVQSSWTRESFFLPEPAPQLFFQGWVSGEAAEAIFGAAGADRRALLGQAETKDFKPVSLGLTARVRQKPAFRTVVEKNVAGVVRPAKARKDGRYVIFSAHYDHLGKDENKDGDQVYNGAVDNCSASAALLALARYYQQHARDLKVNLVFAAVTAEEEGLLGSDYFARHLGIPNDSILANINLEMTNVWGETEDVYGIGAKHSDLDDYGRRATEALGLRYIPEREGNLGYFYRSDQLSFARAGIPAVWLHEGITSRGEDPTLIQRKTDDYKKNRYHKVIDQIEPDWDLRSTVQVCRWAQEIVKILSEAQDLPQFKATSSFRRPK